MLSRDMTFDLFFHRISYDWKKLVRKSLSSASPSSKSTTSPAIKSMAMTKRYDHANEERYGAAIEALDAAGKTGSAEALAAARWKHT